MYEGKKEESESLKNVSRRKQFMISAALIGGVNVTLRCIAVSFNAYVSAKVGAEGMGLLTLVMSVFGMSVTLATSGINLASMRLTAEKSARLTDEGASASEYRKCIRSVMLKCCIYALAFGLTTAAAVFCFSDFIGSELLGDSRTVLSIKIFAFSLPAISVSSALSGYFTGVRKVHKNAASSIIEQGVKIILTSSALTFGAVTITDRIEYSCVAVVGGGAVAEGFSLAVNFLMYLFDSHRPLGAVTVKDGALCEKTRLSEVAGVALPIAFGAYARQGLSTAEHLFIPRGMRMSGLGSERSLAAYGVMQGMVFPLILFPSSVLSSAANLLIPELAECRSLNDTKRIKSIITEVFKWSVVFSVGCAAVFFAFADYLGISVYGNSDAVRFIRICAFLVPVMYFDMTVDCMLKGLGEQVHSMRINILDSALSLLLAVVLVPRFGISGYIVSVYVCEGLNCVLSVRKLYLVTGRMLDFRRCLFPAILCATAAVIPCAGVPSHFGFTSYVQLRIVICCLLYLAMFSFFIAIKKKKLPNSVENNCAG